MESTTGGAKFLHRKYPDLHSSHEVKRALRIPAKEGIKPQSLPPSEKIDVYLQRLEGLFTHPSENEHSPQIETIKGLIHREYVIKPDQMPESYFELQRRIAREQGHGDIHISEAMRGQMTDIVINDQRRSLDRWIDYFTSADAPYPSWFKYYALRNVVKLSPYNRESKSFGQRTKSTTTLFPDINPEALSYVLDGIEKVHIKGEKTDDPTKQELLDKSNFAALYANALENLSPASDEERGKISGEWVKFLRGSDATPLSGSLQGKGTGWCTAGEAMAATQLKTGDFYVFYSTDNEGGNTIPRVAIRMQGDQIAEVRGINKNQELEPSLIETADEKMSGLGGAEKFKKKSADMKRLTLLNKKIQEVEDLSDEEMRFLYETDSEIEGFGYDKDPRILELKFTLIERKINEREPLNEHEHHFLDSRREVFYEDATTLRIKELKIKLAKLSYAQKYACEPEEVVLSRNELNERSVVLAGDLFALFDRAPQDMTTFPPHLKVITGDAIFSGSQIQSLGELEIIEGQANFALSPLRSFEKLHRVGKYLNIGPDITDLGELESIGEVDFGGTQIQSLGGVKRIEGQAIFMDSEVEDLGELVTIGGFANFINCPVRSLGKLRSIGKGANLADSAIEDLGELKSIGGIVIATEGTDLDFGAIATEGIKYMPPNHYRKITEAHPLRATDEEETSLSSVPSGSGIIYKMLRLISRKAKI